MPAWVCRLLERRRPACFSPAPAGETALSIEAELATRRDLETLETRLNARFETLEYRLTIKLGSFIMLATGIIIAVFKL